MDTNWPCINEDIHQKKTHPSDLVCHYEDPYSKYRIYINIDLKSYAADSISKSSIGTALRSLAKTIQCANASPDWSDQFAATEMPWETVGLLFVYNHDGQAKPSDFDRYCELLSNEEIGVPKGRRLYTFGPSQIPYLQTVAGDIQRMYGAMQGRAEHSFFYPDLISKKAKAQEMQSASLELLLGPWQLVHLKGTEQTSAGNSKHLLYYKATGETTAEFVYLIDYLFRFQLLGETKDIRLRMVNPAPNASVIWRKAVDEYVQRLHGLPEIRKRLDRVRYESVSRTTLQFSELEIGLIRG
ncbi:hypothetical protein COSO111634_11935 [Corallococcus soli]